MKRLLRIEFWQKFNFGGATSLIFWQRNLRKLSFQAENWGRSFNAILPEENSSCVWRDSIEHTYNPLKTTLENRTVLPFNRDLKMYRLGYLIKVLECYAVPDFDFASVCESNQKSDFSEKSIRSILFSMAYSTNCQNIWRDSRLFEVTPCRIVNTLEVAILLFSVNFSRGTRWQRA